MKSRTFRAAKVHLGLLSILALPLDVWAQEVVVDVSPIEEVVFDWGRDSCDRRSDPSQCVPHGDHVDGAPRAFVNAAGQVVLVTPSDSTYRSVGPNLNQVVRDCSGPILPSSFDANPGHHDDAEWLMSPYTLNGRDVVAISYTEYQAWCHLKAFPEWSSVCADVSERNRCQMSSITFATSHNGGKAFSQEAAPSHVLASLPGTFDPVMVDPGVTTFSGYRAPSNIFRGPDGAFYFFISQHDPSAEPPQSSCLLRTTKQGLADPASWLAFDGLDFTVPLRGGRCPDAVGAKGMHVSYNTYLGRYVALGFTATGFGPRLSTAADTVTSWGAAIPILATPLPWQGDGTWRSYPVLIQPGDPSRNFEVTDRSPYLYYVYSERAWTKEEPMRRQLRRRRIRFSRPEDRFKEDVLALGMNEFIGRTTLDSSFYGNDALLEGATRFISERKTGLRAIAFPGDVAGRLLVPSSAELELVDSLTIRAFVKVDMLPEAGFARILSKGGGKDALEYGLFVPGSQNACAGRLHFSFSGNGRRSSSCSAGRIDDGVWHEVALVYDQTTLSASYYVDKHLDAVRVHGQPLGRGVIRRGAPIEIGTRINGILDGLRLANHAVPAAALTADTHAGSSDFDRADESSEPVVQRPNLATMPPLVVVAGQSNAALTAPWLEGLLRENSVVNCAMGGTSIAQWQRGKWVYQKCLEKVLPLIKDGHRVSWIFFMQGERDSREPIMAAPSQWATLFHRFANHFRIDLASKSTPIIYAQIGKKPTDRKRPFWREIQEQQRSAQIDRPLLRMFVTRDITPYGPERGPHWCEDKYETIAGRAIATYGLWFE